MSDTVHTTPLRGPRCIRLDATCGAPWRNGGGVTRELLRWPDSDAWQLRISVADIAANGPFSTFEGVQRWFTLLSGTGVVLDFAGPQCTLRPGDAPLAFDGLSAPDCRLLGGPVRDLNLMYRGGEGGMAVAAPATPWTPPAGASAGLYARVAGHWHAQGGTQAVAADSLLWFDHVPAGCWRFEPSTLHGAPTLPAGWWLHHLPSGASA